MKDFAWKFSFGILFTGIAMFIMLLLNRFVLKIQIPEFLIGWISCAIYSGVWNLTDEVLKKHKAENGKN